MPVKDLFHFGGPLLNQSLKEYITPHKISVSILIQEFCYLKTKKFAEASKQGVENDVPLVTLDPQHRRDFCMLILKLIQCPDMEYNELIAVLESGKYALISDHLENFKKELVNLAQRDVGSIMDTILNLGRLIVEPAHVVPLINKSSPTGVFLRRVALFFDKLAFSQLVETCKAFQSYLNCGRKTLSNVSDGSQSCIVLNPQNSLLAHDNLSPSLELPAVVGSEETSNVQLSISPQSDLLLKSIRNCDKINDTDNEQSVNMSKSNSEMELADSNRELSTSHIHIVVPPGFRNNVINDVNRVSKALKYPTTPSDSSSRIDNVCFDDKKLIISDSRSTWSRRQAELFIARQSSLIQTNDTNAIPPPQLQKIIRDVLKANPEHAEAHYLSYLNCLRVKEVCGSIDSLHHYFDRITTVSVQEEKNKNFHYAVLNIAILHAQFGHKKAAVEALKEAIILAHESKDNLCLQHAQAWLYKLCDDNKEVLMERSISKCSDLSLNYLTSLGLQSFAQFAGMTGGKPALVFEVVMRSDVLNCQFSMPDMFGMSFAHKSALWALYGKSEMSVLSSQLLLHLDSPDGTNTHSADGTCQAICNVANRLIDFGEYKLATVVLNHARNTYQNSDCWKKVEQLLYYTQALHNGLWQSAQNAVLQLSSFNKWESLIRGADLLLHKGDNEAVIMSVTKVLDKGQSICPSLRVRALILYAKASPAAAAPILTNALSIAIYHYLDYLIAVVIMELARIQLKMGLPCQALKLMDQTLLMVLSHGSLYDQSDAMLLFVQCKIASVSCLLAKKEVINESIPLLEKIKSGFAKVEAHSKTKETVYLQALLCNEVGDYKDRNKYALEFRQLDEQYPTK